MIDQRKRIMCQQAVKINIKGPPSIIMLPRTSRKTACKTTWEVYCPVLQSCGDYVLHFYFEGFSVFSKSYGVM
jgi:hypothetical protein